MDDHFIVRIGLTTSLKMDPHLSVVAEASTGAQALELYPRHLPDVVLLDLRLPDLSGIEVTAALRKEFPGVKVIIISSYDAVGEIHRAFQAGAQGYLLKDVLGDELFRAIKTVHAGEQYVPAEVARCLAEPAPGAALTERELKVLQMLIQGLGPREIGEALGLKENAARFQIKIMLAKLGVSDRTQAAAAALRRGLLRWQPSGSGYLPERVVSTTGPEN